MKFFTKKPTIAVHDGMYHADDIFAAAALQLFLKRKATIIRTRNPQIIDASEYVIDVGGVHDPEHNRFDHHQKGGAGVRANGIPYAAFGLVWNTYGEQIAGSAAVAARVESRLVCPIDANDNAYSLTTSTHEVFPYTLQGFLYSERPTWKESIDMYTTSYKKLIPVAERLILREIKIAQDALEANTFVEKAFQQAPDKRILEISDSYPCGDALKEHPEILFIVSPRAGKNEWKVNAVSKSADSFENRKDLPLAWAGLRGAELSAVTGVPDAIFCHNARFLIVVGSRESAVQLAHKAVNEE